MNNFQKVFIYSGFAIALMMISLGLGMIFFASNKNFSVIPKEVLGIIMIGWGSFRGYKSYTALKESQNN